MPEASPVKPVALITGVGPDTGSALARRFTRAGYAVAMLARDASRLAELEAELPDAKGFICDVAEKDQIDATVAAVRQSMGKPEVLIHNAVGGGWGSFLEIKPEMLNRNFQINTMALLHLAQALAPNMIAAGRGAIVATGNTSAIRGRANFAGFAPTKAAQRILAEAMARDLGPKDVHVAYVLIDAVIDVPWARAAMPEKPDAFFVRPADIADEVAHVVAQPRSAWSFNVEIRPFGEVW
ncbi:MAG: SDR family NAD(P)-dependent oxidoreductase [Parvibaculum sp.]